MSRHLLLLGRFHFRRLLRARPRFVGAFLAAVLALLGVSLAAIQQSYTQQGAGEAFRLAIRQSRTTTKTLLSAEPLMQEILPSFDSAQLVDTLHKVAQDVKIPVDEVSYALDGNSARPYLRYRVTLSVTTDYPTIRKFSNSFAQQAPYVSLDTISCSRDDIGAAALNCDLGLSAFYRKAVHG